MKKVSFLLNMKQHCIVSRNGKVESEYKNVCNTSH